MNPEEIIRKMYRSNAFMNIIKIKTAITGQFQEPMHQDLYLKW